VRVPGFMPVVLGSKKIANFTTHSWPAAGSYALAVFVIGTAGLLAYHLVRGRRAALRNQSLGVNGSLHPPANVAAQ